MKNENNMTEREIKMERLRGEVNVQINNLDDLKIFIEELENYGCGSPEELELHKGYIRETFDHFNILIDAYLRRFGSAIYPANRK